ncbi:MAG: HDIG domain-containing protein [Nitrospirae bacterium]|nr:HDIG domain-containing protein [Nitrospirota bacterium]
MKDLSVKQKDRKGSSITAKYKEGLKEEDLIKFSLLIGFAALLAITIAPFYKISIWSFFGTFLIIGILLVILYKDLMRYRPAIFKDYKLLLLICILLSGNLLIGRGFHYVIKGFSQGLGNIDPLLSMYAVPLAVGSLLTALLIDIHTAIVFSVITSLLAGIWLESPIYSVFTFAAGLTAAFGVIRCKRRSALWRAGLFVSLVCIFTSLTINILNAKVLTIEAPISIGFALFNGIIVTTLASAFLPLLEYSFKLTTDISLLELLDLNQPLMRNLLVMSPGTYHHSIIVGNLAESAAEAVGVNPLMVRVGAYYHDIGKMKMPEYFIENQAGLVSKHDKITPHMSGMVLISHVKEGVELAKQHKLPEAVIDIINQHHGTSLITYFYQKAKELQDSLSENDFRYPGPRPQTRAAALVLMADAVEAASRVLTEPTPARITTLVEKVINHFFIDGQLNDCELTLKDLQEIKKHFIYILTGMFHRRISYPGFDFKSENFDKAEPKPQAAKQDKNKKGSTEDPFQHRTTLG